MSAVPYFRRVFTEYVVYNFFLSTDVVQSPVSNSVLGFAVARLFIRVDSTMELRMFILLLTYTYVIARKEQQYVSKRETHCGQGF
jgi:hypothetical protein